MKQTESQQPKEPKPRKPRARKATDLKTVHEAALRLTLSDQVELCKDLKAAIQQEVVTRQEKAKAAQDIASGL